MNPTALVKQGFMQACWLVPDLPAAIDAWATTAGVGPFFWFAGVPVVDGHHRGRPAEFPDVTAAMSYSGDLQIELVCQDNDDPGVFRDVYPSGRFGLHHLARRCEDYEAERDALLDQGAELAFEGVVGDSRTCWVDTVATLGFMIELLEPSPMRDGWFASMRTATENWDGTDRIVGGPRPEQDR